LTWGAGGGFQPVGARLASGMTSHQPDEHPSSGNDTADSVTPRGNC
jgi:hypothetical protein